MTDPRDARIAALEAALRPFAAIPVHPSTPESADFFSCFDGKIQHCVNAGHLRAAARAIAGTSPAASPEAIVRAALKAVLSLAIDDATIVAAHVRALAADPAAVRAIGEGAKL